MGGNPVFYRLVNALTVEAHVIPWLVKWLTRIGLDSMVAAIPLRVASKNLGTT
jgi:hypothetical protein